MRAPLPLLALLSTAALNAQHVQWLTTGAIGYDTNPDMPSHLVCASGNDQVYVGRSTSLTYLYNAVHGNAVVERLNAEGEVVWSFTLGDSVLLQSMAATDGMVMLGGQFFRRLHLNGEAVLPALHGNEFPETFLMALDQEGQLLWQRNIPSAPTENLHVQAVTFDGQGRGWYATCNFFRADIMRVDATGAVVETRPLEEAKTIGSISFDPWDGLYVSGSASTPGITVNGSFFPLAEQYNFFVARMGVDGVTQWLQHAPDITFQRPRVAADGSGHAYLVGTPFDSINWGSIHFQAPQWTSTFFLARLDSTGVFEWGYQPPADGSITGQFTLGKAEAMGLDGAGNVHLLGVVQGQVPWGNNVTTSAGGLQDRAVTLVKIDSTGTPLWEIHGGSNDHDVPQGIAVLPTGVAHVAVLARDTFLLGPYTAPLASAALVVARIDPQGTLGLVEGTLPLRAIGAYPSPFANTFQLLGDFLPGRPLRVNIRDGAGRIVESADRPIGLGSTLAAGCYLVEVFQDGHRGFTRVVKH